MSDHQIHSVGSNNNLHNSIIENQENQQVQNGGNQPAEMQNAKKSGSKLALALKITATILTAGLFGIGWGIYALVKHARKSSNNQPLNKDNTGLPENNIIDNQKKANAKGKVEDLTLEPLAEPYKYTVEINEAENNNTDVVLTGDALTKFKNPKKINIEQDLDTPTAKLNGYGNLSEMLEDLFDKLGNDNGQKLLKKIFGKDYQAAADYCINQGYDNHVFYTMAFVYKMKQDAANKPDDELFKNATDPIKLNTVRTGEIVKKFVDTINDVLKENNITSEINIDVVEQSDDDDEEVGE